MSGVRAIETIDRRRWPRFDVDIGAVVTVAGAPADVPLRITSASARGVFIAMSPQPRGTRLILRIHLDDDAAREIRVAGEVVRTVEAPPGAPMPTGCGIFLTETDEAWTNFCSHLGQET